MDKHKEHVISVFDRAAPDYGETSCAFFDYFGARLVELAMSRSRAGGNTSLSALDVATGKGAVLFPLAKAIGAEGNVTGIDLSPQMIEQTIYNTAERGVEWVDLQCMDAEELEFADASFEFVFCSFAIFFFPNLAKALSEFRRVLKPGGLLAVTVWGCPPKLDKWLGAEASKLAALRDLDATSFSEEGALKRTLEAAQFDSVHIAEESKTFYHETPEDWWASLHSHGMRSCLEPLNSEQLEDLRKRAFDKARECDAGKGVPEELQVFYGFGVKA